MSQPTTLADKSIPQIVMEYPQTEAVFQRFGINPDYKALQFETVTASAKVNQVDEAALMTALTETVSGLAN